MLLEVGGRKYKITCKDPYTTHKRVPDIQCLTKEEIETLKLVTLKMNPINEYEQNIYKNCGIPIHIIYADKKEE